jgi:hypothetical protein
MTGALLATYLNDHYAAAVGGVELARRVRASNSGNWYGEELAQLTAEIEDDLDALRGIMRSFGVSADPLKAGAAWIAEKLGRAKLNGHLFSYSPLSRLEELELLLVGVEGKLLLWEGLGALPDPPDQLDTLIEGARSQRRRLRRLRRRAVQDALGD